MADTATKVTFKHATVKRIGVKDGKVQVLIEAPLGEGDATTSDFADFTSGSFLGQVVISGRVQQTALDFKLPKQPSE